MKKVLVFAAHQDDETIGCGGTISKFSKNGSEVTVVFVTDGSTGFSKGQEHEVKSVVSKRSKESKKACNLLGVNEVIELRLPCQKIENNQENFHSFIKIIRDQKPNLVITHSDNDKHRDHLAVNKLCIEAAWKANEDIHPELGCRHKIDDLWCFEITDLICPDYYVDITETYEDKIAAFQCYDSQNGIVENYSNLIDGLSKVRGFNSGVLRAEGFKSITPFGKLI